MAEMPSGAAIFIETALQLSIDRVFTLVGDHLNLVLSIAADRGMEVVHFRHESAVVHAADAWARLHRKPALSLVTGGPGHTNSLTGIATAQANGTPLIAVSGAPARAAARRTGFQDVDQVAMAAPAAKWSYGIATPDQIGWAVAKAHREASTGRMGVAHLTIPVDCFSNEAAPAIPFVPPALIVPAASIDRALELLADARKPIVIGGSGLWWADAGEALSEFLDKSGLPYFDVTMARGMIDETRCPTHFGYADPALNRGCLHAFSQADVVLVLGKRIDYRLMMGGTPLFNPAARFIQVDIHPQEFASGRAIDVAVWGDAAAFLRAANREVSKSEIDSWLLELATARDEWRASLEATAESHQSDEAIHPASFYVALNEQAPVQPLISWDGGDFVHWGRALLPARFSGGWLRLGPMASIGAALPNAIAMQMARPKQPVMLVTGDGAFGFYLAELDTAVRYKLPIVIIVGNDGGWGLERELQSRTLGSTVACELGRMRYDLIAQGFGCEGEHVRSLSELRPALERAFTSQVPYVLNVEVQGAASPFTEWQLRAKTGK